MTLENFEDDFYFFGSNLEGFRIEEITVRDRRPEETSQSNLGDPYYQVTIHFSSKGEIILLIYFYNLFTITK